MTSRDFCYWLQGYFEIGSLDNRPPSLTGDQSKIIQKHLAMVFAHEIDPSFAEDLEKLRLLHKKPQVHMEEESDENESGFPGQITC